MYSDLRDKSDCTFLVTSHSETARTMLSRAGRTGQRSKASLAMDGEGRGPGMVYAVIAICPVRPDREH